MSNLAEHMQARERELDEYQAMDSANDANYQVTVTESVAANDGNYGRSEVKTYELAPYIEEQREVMAACLEATNEVQAETGNSILNDRVEDLGQRDGKKIGGVFHTGTKETKFDTLVADAAVQSMAGVDQLKQVGLHESIHWQAHTNAEKRGEPMLRIIDEKFEEAMCETAVSLVTGEISAYEEYMGILQTVAKKVGKSSGALSRMYREGRFTELNMMYFGGYDE
ncbi:MAG: hypothetical protein Q8P68_06370 [Candidatus Peregrinibacteria bacterium]|nr:hypothetical protein [Candidatus Peregrinibacteria bacterium]MDZ4244419.1 hypothetical protein [Candidatus Gracilibacteria bacterium]